MSWKTCAAAVRQAAGRELSDDQVAEIFEAAQRRKRALEASGRIDLLDTRLREAVKEDADRVRIEAALAKKHAALSVIARDRIARESDALLAQNIKPTLIGNAYRNTVLAHFEGTTKALEGGRRSVEATKLAFEARFIGGMMADVVREVPHAERMLRQREFLDDVVREMAQPGSTRNGDAAKVGAIFARRAEESRFELNRLGANIGRLEGWAGPQVHDADRLLTAGKDAWVRAILPRLDLERTFEGAAPDDAARILGNVWENIVYSPDRSLTASEPSDIRRPPNLARALERHRVLHFKSADDWLAYSQDFGHGHIFDAIVSHQSRAAQNAALMQKFGPNPGVTLQAELERLRRLVDQDERVPPEQKQAIKATLRAEGGEIAKAYRVASGQVMMPHSQTFADIGSTVRVVQAMAKLGGAVISALSDLTVAVANLRYNGLSFGEAVGEQFRELMRGRGRAEQRELAYLIGEGFDGVIGHIASPYVANDGGPGMALKAQTAFFRWTGLTLWTDANRAAVARVLSAHLGRNAGREFGALPERMQNALRQHGIDGATWNTIRQGVRTIDGRPYIAPGLADAEADMALRRYFADEARLSILEADAATQRYSTQGTQRGTLEGEALRFIMQFKGYPLAFTRNVLGRAMRGGEGATFAGAAHLGTLIAGLTVLGYGSMTAKDMIRGYEPRNPTDPKTIMAALVQGGGAGIYGDFIFAEASRTGNTPVENFFGPTVSDLGRLWRVYADARNGEPRAGDALSAFIASVPFANVWFARPALDLLVLNELRETLSPGFLARQDIRRVREYGQDALIAPSDRMALDLF